MIEGRNQVAVTREVRGEVGGGATVAAAVVRVEDERPRAGLVGAPDIAREETVAGMVARFEGMGADGERTGGRGGAIHLGLPAWSTLLSRALVTPARGRTHRANRANARCRPKYAPAIRCAFLLCRFIRSATVDSRESSIQHSSACRILPSSARMPVSVWINSGSAASTAPASKSLNPPRNFVAE